MDIKKSLIAAAVCGLSSQGALAGNVKCWNGWDKKNLKNVSKDTNGCAVVNSDKKAIQAKFPGKYPKQSTHECGGNIAPKHATWVNISKKDCAKNGGFYIKKQGDKKVVEVAKG